MAAMTELQGFSLSERDVHGDVRAFVFPGLGGSEGAGAKESETYEALIERRSVSLSSCRSSCPITSISLFIAPL